MIAPIVIVVVKVLADCSFFVSLLPFRLGAIFRLVAGATHFDFP